MAAQMSDAEKQWWWSHKFTLKGRLFHSDLITPGQGKNGKIRYSTMFVMRKDDPENAAQFAAMQTFLQQVRQHYFPTIPEQFYVNPIKDYDTYQRQDGKPSPDYLKGHYWMNASSGEKRPPVVITSQGGHQVMDPAEVYSGRNAVVQISFFKIDAEKKGVSTNINTVCLLPGGDRVASGFSINPQEIFGSFIQDMGGSFPGGPAPAPAPAPAPTGYPAAPTGPAPTGYPPAAPAPAAPAPAGFPPAAPAPAAPTGYPPAAPAAPAGFPLAAPAPAAPTGYPPAAPAPAAPAWPPVS